MSGTGISASDVNRKITSITGKVNTTASTSGYNTASGATIAWADGTAEAYTPNMYCPINFLTTSGNNLKHGKIYGQEADWFFMNPKRSEFAQVVWAVYDGVEGNTLKFVNDDETNGGMKAGFNVKLGLNIVSSASTLTSKLEVGKAYDFHAIIGRVESSTSGSAPRRITPATDAPMSGMTVYALDLDGSVVTGVTDVTAGKAVQSVRYYNVAGQESLKPFEGINIVRTVYTDGTSSVAKVVR